MGFKKKFKDGDKVRVIDINSSDYKKTGIIKWYGYPLHIENAYFKKKIYYVDFKTYSHEFYSHQLEKVEDFSNTKSNKLSISDLKPGMKVRIRPDLKEGYTSLIYVSDSMTYFKGTIQTIKTINSNNTIILNRLDYSWDINCFSEIVEEPKKEVKTSEKIELPLKEGQVVTLLDGKKYQVIRNNTSEYTCSLCSLSKEKCGDDKCYISHINGNPACKYVIPRQHYFKLNKGQKPKNNSSKSLTISDFKVGMRVRVKENFDKIITNPDYSSNISSKMKSFKEKELIVEGIGIDFIIAKSYYWLPEWLEIIDESTNSSNSVENSSVEEIGIITKVNFTLTDFKSEKLEHSKFTVL